MKSLLWLTLILLLSIHLVNGAGWIRKTRRVMRPRIGVAPKNPLTRFPLARFFIRRARYWRPFTAMNSNRRVRYFDRNDKPPPNVRGRSRSRNFQVPFFMRPFEVTPLSAWRPLAPIKDFKDLSASSSEISPHRLPILEYSPSTIEREKILEMPPKRKDNRKPMKPRPNIGPNIGNNGKMKMPPPGHPWKFNGLRRPGRPNFWKYFAKKRRPNMRRYPKLPRYPPNNGKDEHTKAPHMVYFNSKDVIPGPHNKRPIPTAGIMIPKFMKPGFVEINNPLEESASTEMGLKFKSVNTLFKHHNPKLHFHRPNKIYQHFLNYIPPHHPHAHEIMKVKPSLLIPVKSQSHYLPHSMEETTTKIFKPSPPLIPYSKENSFNIGFLESNNNNNNQNSNSIKGSSQEQQQQLEAETISSSEKLSSTTESEYKKELRDAIRDTISTSTSVSISTSNKFEEPKTIPTITTTRTTTTKKASTTTEKATSPVYSSSTSSSTPVTSSTTTTTEKSRPKRPTFPTMSTVKRPIYSRRGTTNRPYRKSTSSEIGGSSSLATPKNSGEIVMITRGRSKVKEYKPQNLLNYSQVLSFDKVDEASSEGKEAVNESSSPAVSAEKGSSSSIVTATSLRESSSTPKGKSSETTGDNGSSTASPMENFDPMQLIHSWFSNKNN